MDTRHTGIIDHASADAFLGRRAVRALPGRASRLERRGDDIAVLFHGTAVVTYHPDGSVTLDSGGWLTSTTKQRINAYTRAPVYSVKGKWLVGVPGGGKVPFRDGIRVDVAGRTAGKGRKAARGAALRAAIPARPEFKPILRRLKIEAEAGARARGHALGRWLQLSPRSMEATCKLCGRGVTINARPAPNGIDIGGSACGLNCHMAKRGGKGRAAGGGSVGIWKPEAVGDQWYIVNATTGGRVRIGRVGGPRGLGRGINYRDRAVEEANRRNGAEYAWLPPGAPAGAAGPTPKFKPGQAVLAHGRRARITSWGGGITRDDHAGTWRYKVTFDDDGTQRHVNQDGIEAVGGGKGRRAAGAFPPGYVVTRPRDPRTNKILWEVEAPNGECVVDGEATRRDALAAARAHARDAGFIKPRGAARARAGRRGGKRRADVGGLAASILQLTR